MGVASLTWAILEIKREMFEVTNPQKFSSSKISWFTVRLHDGTLTMDLDLQPIPVDSCFILMLCIIDIWCCDQ